MIKVPVVGGRCLAGKLASAPGVGDDIGGRRRGSRNTAAVCNDTCVTAASAEGGRAGANWAVTGSHERRGEQEGHEKSSQAHRDLQQDGFPARQRSSRKAAGL